MFVALVVLVDGGDACFCGGALALVVIVFGCRTRSVVVVVGGAHLAASEDEVLELAGTELCGADAKHKRDGVHEVGLATTIGTDDCGERIEGTDDLVAAVGFEVVDL